MTEQWLYQRQNISFQENNKRASHRQIKEH